jgi:hypothetical protein
MIQIELADLIFNDPTGPDGDGIYWYVTDMQGWEAPEQRLSALNLTGLDGVAIGESVYAARTVILEGVVKAPSEALFWQAYNDFNRKTSLLYALGTLKVHEQTTVKTLGVIRSAPPKVAFLGVGSFTFQLSLMAPQPIKLDDTEQTAAYGTITNGGNYLSYPVITLTDGGNYTLTNTTQGAGATLTITAAPAGTVLDLRNRTALSGTTDVYSTVSATSIWWALLPGSNTLTKTGGAASIAWRNAWI